MNTEPSQQYFPNHKQACHDYNFPHSLFGKFNNC